MNETYKFTHSTLTRGDIEEQIKGIDRMLKDYDSLVQFLWKHENRDWHIMSGKQRIERLKFTDFDFEDTLQKIKSEFEKI